MQLRIVAIVCAIVAACGESRPVELDAAIPDAAVPDAAIPDAMVPDAAPDAMLACLDEDRDDPYVAGMSKVGDNGYTFVLVEAAPAPPVKGDNRWTVRVLEPGGAPVDGLTWSVYPYMPDHGHGTVVVASATPTAEAGTVTIAPINYWMKGYWTTRLRVSDATPTVLDQVIFRFCVEGE